MSERVERRVAGQRQAAGRRRSRFDDRHAALGQHRDKIGDALIRLVVLAKRPAPESSDRRASAARASARPPRAPRRGCRRFPSASAPPPAPAPARCRGRPRRGARRSRGAARPAASSAPPPARGSRAAAAAPPEAACPRPNARRSAGSRRASRSRISSPRRSVPGRRAAGARCSQASASGDAVSLTMAIVIAPPARAASASRSRSGLRPDCEMARKSAFATFGAAA